MFIFFFLNVFQQAFNQDKRRLELRFRPDSVYCKPAFGDRSATTGLLMKVKIRRNKNDPTDVKTETQVLGLIEDVYKFESKIFISSILASIYLFE